MSHTALHLVHVAMLAALFYLAALTANYWNVEAAVVLFLPLGMLMEARFWYLVFVAAWRKPSRAD